MNGERDGVVLVLALLCLALLLLSALVLQLLRWYRGKDRGSSQLFTSLPAYDTGCLHRTSTGTPAWPASSSNSSLMLVDSCSISHRTARSPVPAAAPSSSNSNSKAKEPETRIHRTRNFTVYRRLHRY